MNSDPHVIADEESLRQVVGAEVPLLKLKVETAITLEAREFIGRSPFLVLTTSDAQGNLDASPKGDAPGFVHVLDDATLLIPDRPGNRLVFGHLNILRNPHVGVLFMVPATNESLRVNGRAELTRDPRLLAKLAARDKAAVLAIRVRVEECFFHCGKAFIRSKLWQPESWAPKQTISFGRMFAKKTGGDEAVAASIDAAVKADYENNL